MKRPDRRPSLIETLGYGIFAAGTLIGFALSCYWWVPPPRANPMPLLLLLWVVSGAAHMLIGSFWAACAVSAIGAFVGYVALAILIEPDPFSNEMFGAGMIEMALVGFIFSMIVGLPVVIHRRYRAARSGVPPVVGEYEKRRGRLMPESLFVVRMSDEEMVCERPDGKTERVRWDDLRKVEIVTTSAGPMRPDVFWVLHGTSAGCAVPQGATGDKELLERLQKLPGFDNKAVIDAMGCVSDRRFTCWERKGT